MADRLPDPAPKVADWVALDDVAGIIRAAARGAESNGGRAECSAGALNSWAEVIERNLPVSAAVSSAEPRKGSSSETIHTEDGERVYPCRCGETHRGEYGATDFDRHNCFHDEPIWAIPDDPGHFICGSCGKSFMTEERFNAR